MTPLLPAGPLLGTLTLLLLVLNTVFWAIPLYVLVLVKLVTPRGALRDRISMLASDCAQNWALCNAWAVEHLLRVDLDVRFETEVHRRGQYLVCCNHQSWNDITVLMCAFGRRAPFFKFFLKRQLIWVPVLGLAWWGLDYPFMSRYTRQQIEKNPALKGRDLEATRRACEAFARQPVLVLNFLEGTRYTAAKHAQQASPYRHLLKPKSGGFAFALGAMGERLDGILDVTIAYPDGAREQWDFLCGRVRRVRVAVQAARLPEGLQAQLSEGGYDQDPAVRARFNQWIAELWAAKDQQLARMLQGPAA